MDNGPPFSSEEFKQFLQLQYIEHITSSPHFPLSNGFFERQVKTQNTTLSTIQDAGRTLNDLLLELQSTSITPKMPALREILHNRMIQHPGKPSMSVDMEAVWDYLITKKQYQKTYFHRAQNVKPLSTLDPSQEVLFLSPADHHTCVPETILDKVSMPRSYTTKAQGKQYSRTRQPLLPSHKEIPKPSCIKGPIQHFPSPPNKFPKHTATPSTLASLYTNTKASPCLTLHHQLVPPVL